VLAATTAFGKTVVAAKMIAARDRNTLVLVHRRQLLDQWVARLQTFLDIPPNKLGVIHGGKKKPTGDIDVAPMQSLVRQGIVSDLVADYGHVVIDECHHLSVVGFEAIARGARAQYMLGLSATVKDGHDPIIFMNVARSVIALTQRSRRPFGRSTISSFSAARSSGLPATGPMKGRPDRNFMRSLLKTRRGTISSSMTFCRRLKQGVRQWSLPNADGAAFDRSGTAAVARARVRQHETPFPLRLAAI
jgi:hypothetical protein